jgi:hypothetical protein
MKAPFVPPVATLSHPQPESFPGIAPAGPGGDAGLEKAIRKNVTQDRDGGPAVMAAMLTEYVSKADLKQPRGCSPHVT